MTGNNSHGEKKYMVQDSHGEKYVVTATRFSGTPIKNKCAEKGKDKEERKDAKGNHDS